METACQRFPWRFSLTVSLPLSMSAAVSSDAVSSESRPDSLPDQPERTLMARADHTVVTLDQTRLPFDRVELVLRHAAGCAQAIATMQVRGAPLIGAVAAFGLALALREAPDDAALDAAHAGLLATRPTAVNLRWALDRLRARVALASPGQRWETAWREACDIADEDVAINRAIGEHGAWHLRRLVAQREAVGRPVDARTPLQLLTHCNAGRLAAVAHGTALAPIYALHRAGVPLHVWIDETRPRNQGASLTAWELANAGVPCTLVADNAGGLLMRQGRVDAVIVGCDRVARNGDVANKIGTLLKALAARDAGVPFWVACPSPTIDPASSYGEAIEIETRSARELTHITGRAADGRLCEVQLVQDGVAGFNPAFDVTPARLVDGLLTEHGMVAASVAGVAAVLAASAAPRTSL
jgi:methylthioribose-1-phosphate isomerase